MKLFQPLGGAVARLSQRERLLAGAALMIGYVMISIYGILLPGQAAARSAADRNVRAASELAEAQTLAARAGAVTSVTEEALAQLVASASARGLTVLDSRIVDGAAVLKLGSAGSVDVLAWVAETSSSATLTSLSITAAREGGVAVEASFGRAS